MRFKVHKSLSCVIGILIILLDSFKQLRYLYEENF